MNKTKIFEEKKQQIENYLDKYYFNNPVETQTFHRNKLTQLSKHLGKKSFKEASQDDIITFVKKYASSGYSGIKSSIQGFYRYLYQLEPDDKLPDNVRFLKSEKERTRRKKGEELIKRERLITPEEYKSLLNNAIHPYQKAIIETLYLFGVRISELLSMRSNDVIETDQLTKIIVRESKTEPREVTIMETPQYLIEYYRNYQRFKNDSDKPLWASPHYRQSKKMIPVMRRTAVNKMIQEIAKKSGIKRIITPHDFRHTAISRDLAQGMPQSLVEQKYGLVHGSGMMKIYDHNGNKQLVEYYNKTMIDKPETHYAIEQKYIKEKEQNTQRIDQLEQQIQKIESLIKIKFGFDLNELNDIESIQSLKTTKSSARIKFTKKTRS